MSKPYSKAPPSFYHVCAVVKDIEKTMQLLSSMWGVGPWKVFDFPVKKEKLIIGKSDARIKLAGAKLGPIILELIQPVEGKSIWSDFIEARGEGIHHIAFSVSDWEKQVSDFQKHGGKLIEAGIARGRHWGYMVTNPGGLVIEFEELINGKSVLDFD